MKAKLENLEHKHAKYLVAKQGKDCLISCQPVYTKEDFLP